MSSARVRFAPSPTGTLHVGGARTALFNWLYARNQGGTFVLRIEDTDQERSTQESHEQILRSLRWLGLDWDEGPDAGGDHGPYVQSERLDLHRQYADKLLELGLGYPCYCSAEELAGRRERARQEKRAPGYDGRCRELTREQVAAHEAAGRKPVLRVRMPDTGSVVWTDIVHGDTSFEATVLDDWVAVKSDGFATYNFACVVDDGLMEISHVLRGDDHISNTPRQIHLFREFGFRVPKFGHMPMILGPDGKRLSKRHGAASVEEFRDAGFLPEAFVNYLALLGWSPGNDQEFFTPEQLVKKFSLKRLNHTAAVFDPDKCRHINGLHMKEKSLEEKVELVWPYLREAGLVEDGDAVAREKLGLLLTALGNRFSHLGESVAHLEAYFHDAYAIDPDGVEQMTPEAQAMLAKLADRYAALPAWSAEAAEAELRALAEELGVKAGELIHPARFAATGHRVGPGVFEALELLGQATVVRRLKQPKLA